MKKGKALIFIVAAVILTGCLLHKKTQYNYPEGIPGEEKVKLHAFLEKGRKLYEMNCAKCHDSTGKSTPDFSVQQIDNYTAATLKRDPKIHAVAANMDPEQLFAVFSYLRLRKKSNHASK